MIKLVGICGSRVKQGNMEAFLDVAMNHARQHQDVEAESIALWGGKDSHLPLTPEIVESLLDYLQKSRPSYSYSNVFLTCRAPYHPLPRYSSLSVIVERSIRAAGIEIPNRDAHAFRHCFATRMLHKGYSLKEIADVLGHHHLGTTFIYTKVEFHALRQVAIEWPQEVPQ